MYYFLYPVMIIMVIAYTIVYMHTCSFHYYGYSNLHYKDMHCKNGGVRTTPGVKNLWCSTDTGVSAQHQRTSAVLMRHPTCSGNTPVSQVRVLQKHPGAQRAPCGRCRQSQGCSSYSVRCSTDTLVLYCLGYLRCSIDTPAR